jgi:phosphoglycerate dehydrogenase-like enzyme
MRVLRWGRSAYETDADLALEAAATEALGGSYHLHVGANPPLSSADVLVVNSGTRVDAAAIGAFAGRLVLTTTSGYDHIDLEAAGSKGVLVARCPLARRDAVVEHALSSIIRLLRNLPRLEAEAVDGRWARGRLPDLAPNPLSGARVAVVGLGVIGGRMATVLDALGAEVIGLDPAFNATDFDAMDGVDAITLHCSLSASSANLLSGERISRLRWGTVVVNTARGDVLDVDAAIAAVRSGQLRGLAVDVFPEEPYPALAVGAAVPGVLFTPHASGYVRDLGARVAREVAATLSAFVAGKTLPHAVAGALR